MNWTTKRTEKRSVIAHAMLINDLKLKPELANITLPDTRTVWVGGSVP